jgi:ribose/xylose/arabinose/galactoside ABC-type transport system permease subunit
MIRTRTRPDNLKKNPREVAVNIIKNEHAALGFVLVALISIIGALTGGKTTSITNVKQVLVQSSIVGVAAIGQAFVILTAGIDLSVGGIGFFAAVLGAALMTDTSYLRLVSEAFSTFQALPLMLFLGIGFGAVNGWAISRIGLPPLISTLAIWKICQGGGFITGGHQSISGMPENLAFFGGSVTFAGVPVPVIIFICVAAVAYFTLNHTTFGRSVYAIGGNPISAWLSGTNVKRGLFTVYIISGFLAALTGILSTARVMSASMRSLEGLELRTIAAVVVGGVSLSGGKGSIIGVVLGVLIMGIATNGMRLMGAGTAEQGILTGIIIFTAVAIDFFRRRRH